MSRLLVSLKVTTWSRSQGPSCMKRSPIEWRSSVGINEKFMYKFELLSHLSDVIYKNEFNGCYLWAAPKFFIMCSYDNKN